MRTMVVAALTVVLIAGISSVAAEAPLPHVQLNADNAAGREVEQLTRQSVARDYARAWQSLADALEQNRADLIDRDFVGIAAERLTATVADQAKAGLRTRYVDHGHKLDVVFYSPEGLSIQVRDTAQLERQVLDGDKVLFTEQITAHYVGLMTPTEVRWKVRLLQQVPTP